MKRRWLYSTEGEEAKIFTGSAIDDALAKGWLKRPVGTVVAEDITTLDTNTLRDMAKAKKIRGAHNAKRETLITKLKES
jgi:hypothetical protein